MSLLLMILAMVMVDNFLQKWLMFNKSYKPVGFNLNLNITKGEKKGIIIYAEYVVYLLIWTTMSNIRRRVSKVFSFAVLFFPCMNQCVTWFSSWLPFYNVYLLNTWFFLMINYTNQIKVEMLAAIDLFPSNGYRTIPHSWNIWIYGHLLKC